MREYLTKIDGYVNKETPDFWQFYNWFQDSYFGDKDIELRKQLTEDEIGLMDQIDELLAYAGTDPTEEERANGIFDQNEFREKLKTLRDTNISIWKRYGLE
jgi:hypothetical protein